jgi:peptidyl-prolyl cis-trans isomerase A (cyclophilin A)
VTACNSTPPEPEPRKNSAPASKETIGSTATGSAAAPPAGPANVRVSPDDPLQGNFSLADATQGLAGEGKLMANLQTSLGTLSCELYEDRAPLTVANFVGLARGLRPFKDDGQWVKRPGYDGTTFHRVIRGFMIQGGDPKGTGAGEPGYVIPDEIWPGATHNERGLLCMANRGPNTNGMQFFILDGAAPHLDKSYTIFGKCSPPDVIQKIASVETRGDRALEPPRIEKVTIERRK